MADEPTEYIYETRQIATQGNNALFDQRIRAEGGQMDFKDVELRVKDVVKQIHSLGIQRGDEGMIRARYQVVFKMPRGWVGTHWFNFGQRMPTDLTDSDYNLNFESFKYSEIAVIIQEQHPIAVGCNDNSNDCLYECLKFAFGGSYMLPKNARNAEVFKQTLGLKRDDLVPTEKLQEIEKLFDLTIRSVGDYVYEGRHYEGSVSDERIAHITVKNNHCTITKEHNNRIQPLNNVRYHPAKSVMFYKIDGQDVNIRDNEGFNKTFSTEDFMTAHGARCPVLSDQEHKETLYVSVGDEELGEFMDEW